MNKFGISEFHSKPTNYYNHDMIISIGYRVKSKNKILFRKWTNQVLKDYLVKGYTINNKIIKILIYVIIYIVEVNVMEIIGIRDLATLENMLKGKQVESTPDTPFLYITGETEAIVIDNSKLRPFRKVPEVTTFMNIEDIKLLEVINNRYIQIIDKDTKEVLFTEEEFFEYRKKMSGIKTYNAGDFIFADNIYFPELDYYLELIDRNIEEVNYHRKAVYEEIINIFKKYNLTVTIGCNSGGDIELVEAGSTARYTNIPSSDKNKKWDFDFTVRLDEEKTWLVKDILEKELKAEGHITRTSKYKVRLIDVTIPGLEKTLDLDFSLTPQKEKYLSTDDAINERLDNMKENDYERYRLVIANIMYAKELLKKAGSYKPSRGILEGDRANGGLGGVGIECWILQHGGSFIEAAKDFLSHAEGKTFKEFECSYSIMDFGMNHVSKSKREWPYDNFVINNMRYLGYEKMVSCLKSFINALRPEQQIKM